MPALVQMLKSFVDRIFGYQTPLLGEGSGSGDICWFLKRKTRETNQFDKPAMHTARKHDGAFRAEDEFFMADELRTLSTCSGFAIIEFVEQQPIEENRTGRFQVIQQLRSNSARDASEAEESTGRSGRYLVARS